MGEDTVISNWTVGRLHGAVRIPSSWKVERLAEVSTLESGHTPARTNPAYWDGDIPWVSLHDTSALSFGEIFDTKLRVTNDGISNSSARVLPIGTVALSRTATVGKAVLFGREMATSQDFACFLPSDRVDTRYLLHLFKYMAPEWRRLSAGSTHQTIYMPIFKRLQVLLPPLEEQRRIAEILDTIDGTIQATDRVIAKLRQAHTGLTRSLIESSDVQSRTELGRLAESSVDGPFGSALKSSDYVNYEGVRVVRLGNLGDGSFNESDTVFVDPEYAKTLSRHDVLPGDLLMASLGDENHRPGRACLYPRTAKRGIVKADCFRFRLDTSVAWPDYVVTRVNAPDVAAVIRRMSGGVTRDRVNLTALRQLPVPLPSLAEQQRISAILERSGEAIRAEAMQRAKLVRVGAGLAADLLSGSVRTVPA